jgi:hypothetical protein
VFVDKSVDLSVQADHVNTWLFHACALVIAIVVAGIFSWNRIAAMFRARSVEALTLLLSLAFVFAWLTIVLRIFLEPLCFVELSVSKGHFSWSYGLLSLRRKTEVARQDIVAVSAKHRWYGNRLEVAARGMTFRLDNLLDEDLETIERELHRALPEANSR